MAQFNGQAFVRPQVVSFVDDSRLVGPNDASTINLGVLGISTGGQPNTGLIFTSARDARRILRGGELLDAIERAYGPGANTAGAYRVVAVRVNPATQSTFTLVDASAGNAIVLTSTDWGAHTAQIGVRIDEASINIPTPTIATVKKITVTKQATTGTLATNTSQDNVGRASITVQYTGSGTTATMTVTPGVTITTAIGVVTADAISFDLTLPQYATMRGVVDAFNATGKYVASVAGPSETASSAQIDAASAVAIKAAPITFRADLQAQIDFFNSQVSDILVATKASGATKPAAQLTTPILLAGGGEGTTTNTNWQNALDVLATQDVQLVVPVTGDGTLHAMVNTHCQTMSGSQYKRERVCILGGVAGESVTQAKNRASALISDRAQLVWPGVKDYSTDGLGTVVTIPPYMVAAQKAGLSASLPIATSATNRFIGARGLEIDSVIPAQIDELVSLGVTVIERADNRGFRIVKDVTTWQADQKYSRVEMSTRLALDYTSRVCRTVLEPLIGATNGPGLQVVARTNMTAALNDLTARGVLIGGPNVPSFTNLTISVLGDRVEVSVQVAIAVPANFIFLTIFPTVFSTPLPAAS